MLFTSQIDDVQWGKKCFLCFQLDLNNTFSWKIRNTVGKKTRYFCWRLSHCLNLTDNLTLRVSHMNSSSSLYKTAFGNSGEFLFIHTCSSCVPLECTYSIYSIFARKYTKKSSQNIEYIEPIYGNALHNTQNQPLHPDIRCKIITADTPAFKTSSQVTVGQCSTKKVTLP